MKVLKIYPPLIDSFLFCIICGICYSFIFKSEPKFINLRILRILISFVEIAVISGIACIVEIPGYF